MDIWNGKILNKIRKTMESSIRPKNARMQVCMMGARGVGKTSVLTSMFHDMNAVNSGTSLQLTTTKDEKSGVDMTAHTINQKHEELLEMFYEPVLGEKVPNGGIAGDMEEREYYFQFGLKGKSIRIDLVIKDFPGEFLNEQPDTVRQFISESNAVIIAIDTPHLMEENGRFNQAKNCVSLVTDFIIKEFEDLSDDKLVLFVPLKCEKYRNQNRMDEVCKAVECAYAELIAFLSGNSVKSQIVAAIAPIFTVGGVVFSDFVRSNTGEVKMLKNGLPARAEYVYAKQNAQYTPQYCEQPLCYLLAFAAKLYQRTKNAGTGGFMGKLAAVFRLFPDDPALLLEIGKFSRKRVQDKDGYKILTGEHLI